MDSGKGGLNLKKKINKNRDVSFHKLFPELDKEMLTWKKKYIRKGLLKILNDYNSKIVKNIIIACHSASSTIMDILMKNYYRINNIKIYEPIVPTCMYIKKKNYKNILILSTPITEKLKWHYKLLKKKGVNIKYISITYLAYKIDDGVNIMKYLKKIKTKEKFIEKCDCVVLGCTHYNVIKKEISSELKKYKFKGEIIDTNEILYKYFKKNACLKKIKTRKKRKKRKRKTIKK